MTAILKRLAALEARGFDAEVKPAIVQIILKHAGAVAAILALQRGDSVTIAGRDAI